MILRKPLLLLTALAVATFSFAQSQSGLLDSLMRQYAAHKKFNGSVLVAKGGKVLLEQGYGYKNVAAKTPATAADLYQYGSVTKQFTAAVILKLQEEKKLKLEDKLSKFFPQFSFADSVTLRHLLSHTSGIFNYTNDARFMNTEAVKPTTQARIFELFANKPLAFAPGSKYSYSNSNYMLLGYIAEKVSGKPYEALVRQYILKPAGMNTAGFDFAALKSGNKSTGYNIINGNQAMTAGIVDSSASYAAGALYGSVYDLYAWHRALQKGKVLSAQSMKQMETVALNNYALGVVVDTAYGKRVVSHGGGIFGFITDFVRYPEEDLAIVVLSNNGAVPVDNIAKGLAGIVFGQKVEWPAARTEITVPVDILNNYVGEYEITPAFKMMITLEGGQLMAQATGQSKNPLFAESNTKFFLKVVDAQLQFNKNAQGEVESLTLFQGGREIGGKKIK
ncbi:serine hydrolase [Paracnuella aquatica]|uniref:serine hydrolase n=1 Tax=Paracnuella aquatica TaxID=2268757 RepID=UPI000DEEF00F|nr:serine hydrolase [Paracnuella aquatica]RPD46625.1 serine hydrolase [Paracnuella aquatica]